MPSDHVVFTQTPVGIVFTPYEEATQSQRSVTPGTGDGTPGRPGGWLEAMMEDWDEFDNFTSSEKLF